MADGADHVQPVVTHHDDDYVRKESRNVPSIATGNSSREVEKPIESPVKGGHRFSRKRRRGTDLDDYFVSMICLKILRTTSDASPDGTPRCRQALEMASLYAFAWEYPPGDDSANCMDGTLVDAHYLPFEIRLQP